MRKFYLLLIAVNLFCQARFSIAQVPEKINAGAPLHVSIKVTNTGKMAGEEVVQLYITDEEAITPRPIRHLEGFERISLRPGESEVVEFTLDPKQLSMINVNNDLVVESGWFTVAIGGKQPGFTGKADAPHAQVVSGRFRVTGKKFKCDMK